MIERLLLGFAGALRRSELGALTSRIYRSMAAALREPFRARRRIRRSAPADRHSVFEQWRDVSGSGATVIADTEDAKAAMHSQPIVNEIETSSVIGAEAAGNIFLNDYGYQSEMPFGGYKMSGIGREHGLHALHEYAQTKSATVGFEQFQSRFTK